MKGVTTGFRVNLNEMIDITEFYNVEEGVYSQRSEPGERFFYELKAVILHQGQTALAGHYTSKNFKKIYFSFHLILSLNISKIA